MQIFAEIDTKSPPAGTRIIAELPNVVHMLKKKQHIGEYVFAANDTHLLLITQGLWTNAETEVTKLLRHQIEIPLAAAAWFADAIDRRFALPESQGGLPTGKFQLDEWVDGEHLGISRGMNLAQIDGMSIPGYTLWNISRDERRFPDCGMKQSFEFPDPMLFDGGCLQVFRDIAARHANREI